MRKLFGKTKSKRIIALFLSVCMIMTLTSEMTPVYVKADVNESGADIAEDITYTALEGTTQYEESGYDKLVDGDKYNTMWSLRDDEIEGAYVVFETSQPVYVYGYSLTTTGDNENTNTYSINPLSWELYASNTAYTKDADGWVKIAEVKYDRVMQNKNNTTYEFNLSDGFTDGTKETYTYFKYVVKERNNGSRVMKLGELSLDCSTCLHEWKETDEKTEPDCTHAGTVVYACSKCNSTKNVSYGEPTGHDWQATGEKTEPDCLNGGSDIEKCSLCSEIRYVSNDVAALGHEYENGKCIRCGESDNTLKQPEGEGTETNPYKLTTAGEMNWFSKLVNGDEEVCTYDETDNPDGIRQNMAACAKLMNDITFNSNLTERLEFDVDEDNETICANSGEFQAWTPIGNGYQKKYQGTFDGNGKTISGLFCIHTYYVSSAGLISSIATGASVKNLGITDSYFESNTVGTIAVSNSGTIMNCYGDAIVNGEYVAGGLCADNYQGETENAKIINCYSAVKIMGDLTYKGSICGRNLGDVYNCFYDSTKSETGAFGYNGSPSAVAGKSGERFASGEVAYLLSKGYKSDGITYDGSVWGQTIGTDAYPVLNGARVYGTEKCAQYSNTDNLTEREHDFQNGICTACGKYEVPECVDGVYRLENVGNLYWFAGLVNGDADVCDYNEISNPDGIKPDSAANAILMNDIELNKNIGNAYDEHEILQNADQYKKWIPIGGDESGYSGKFNGNGKTISGLFILTNNTSYTYANGFVGNLKDEGEISNLGIINSYVKALYYEGGICGRANAGTIKNSYFSGRISYFNGAGAGGICGYNEGAEIVNCYSSAYIKYPADDSNIAGGICGMNEGTIKNSYYDYTKFVKNAVGSNKGTTDTVSGKESGQFNSGEVAYLLQSGQTSDEKVWGQSIGVDKYPVLDGSKEVYVTTGCISYNNSGNTGNKEHRLLDGECLDCGITLPHDVTYIDMGEEKTASACVTIEKDTTELKAESGKTAWYVVHKNQTINGDIAVSGDVNIILADNRTLTVNGSIQLGEGSNFGIYAQSEGISKGKLIIKRVSIYKPGIGNANNVQCGDIKIAGGDITVTGGEFAAGIGSGYNMSGDGNGDGGTTYSGSCGNIIITGGKVTATSGREGAGIGSGCNSSCRNITITGGDITATGAKYGTGIGSGDSGSCGNITISDGTVSATGEEYGAGIGSGYDGNCGDIEISGGNVTAVGGNYTYNSQKTMGIGSGYNGSSGNFITQKSGEKDGTAYIYANSIGDRTGSEDNAANPWNGIIFEEGTGNIYGSAGKLNRNFVIPADNNLIIGSGKTLEVTDGTIMTNNGTITIKQGGMLKNNGIIRNNGKVENENTDGSGIEGKIQMMLTVSDFDVKDRKYDGTDIVEISNISLSGAMDGDEVSADNTRTYRGTLSSVNAGTYQEVTMRDEIQLTGKDSEKYYVEMPAEAVKKKITIEKADGMTKELEKSYVYTKSCEDTINLAGLLPGDCGNTEYTVETSGDIAYTAKGKPSVDRNILTYCVDAGEKGQTGSIKIRVKMDNYKDSYVIINIELADQQKVKLKEGKPITTKKGIAYGDAISELELDAEFVNKSGALISGTLEYKNKDEKPKAGKAVVKWVFTPDDIEFAPLEGETEITVEKASVTPNMPDFRELTPAYSVKTIGELSSLLPADWKWSDADMLKTLTDNTAVTANAVYSGADKGNYATETVEISVIRQGCDHIYGEPVYTWEKDNSICHAVKTCTRSGCDDGNTGHVVSEDSKCTYSITVPATCEKTGEGTYTATFTEGFATQTKTINLDATGHTYGEPVYTWNDDNTECTAAKTCTAEGCTGAGKVITETVTADVKVTKAPACEEKGTITYTAAFTKEGFATQTKIIETDATGHTYGEPVYTWSDDNTECTAVKTCTTEGCTGADKVITETVKADAEVTKAPSCEEKGTTTYTAVFTKDGFATQTKSVSVKATGHKLSKTEAKAATTKAEGNIEYYTCTVCGKYFADAEGTKEITLESTVIPKKKTSVKVGSTIKDSKGNSYRVLSVSKKNPKVAYKAPKSGVKGSIKVPNTVKYKGKTYKVTAILSNAFRNNRNITAITVGNNVQTIGKSAFEGCIKLKKVTIGKNVKGIEKYAFRNCKKLERITVNTTKLSSKYLKKYAFKGMSAKTVIKVPKSRYSKYVKLFRKVGLSKKVKITKLTGR